jgi:hypothetical protein
MRHLDMQKSELFTEMLSSIDYLSRMHTLDAPSGIGLSNLDAEIMLYITDVLKLNGNHYLNWRTSANL